MFDPAQDEAPPPENMWEQRALALLRQVVEPARRENIVDLGYVRDLIADREAVAFTLCAPDGHSFVHDEVAPECERRLRYRGGFVRVFVQVVRPRPKPTP
jgi:metal-sulfur cluster biosynthetic enzyme